MCARVQSDVLRVLRVLRVPVSQFCTCLWRHVFGVLRVLCVLLGLYVLYALCALYAFSKPYVQHRGPQKRASGQKRTDGRQRNIVPFKATRHLRTGFVCRLQRSASDAAWLNSASDAMGGLWLLLLMFTAPFSLSLLHKKTRFCVHGTRANAETWSYQMAFSAVCG